MLLPFQAKIWFYQSPVDFRKQIDGLILLIADHLQENPTSGALFIFRNRQADKIKLLWFDQNGFWLAYKRMEKGRFKFPNIIDETLSMTREQLTWLLSGIDFTQQNRLPYVKASHFY